MRKTVGMGKSPADAGDKGNAGSAGGPQPDIPSAAVARLATYLHVLRSMSETGAMVVSSGQLAAAAGVNSAILRKDLSHVGSGGVRGVGYDVSRLVARIALALGVEHNHNVVLAGAGHLGKALINRVGFDRRGIKIVAMVEADPQLVGTSIAAAEGELRVRGLAEIPAICAEHRVEIAVLATSDEHAQITCDSFVAAGVQQILNFTCVAPRVPEHVYVRPVDFALELQVMAFNAARRHSAEAQVVQRNSTPGGRTQSKQRSVGV
ncbi:redox-sensing transcriptional repressor Rex [Williamsia soli]|uniref:redox-sensing transcriptional repressor Rex n=1 Tax=Williamsia soli TaxID=364929 RepID=UPI001F015C20|nr:redox-sensing transcriptional repressor Rex [Williamsia soli]